MTTCLNNRKRPILKKKEENTVRNKNPEELIKLNLELENHINQDGDLNPLEGKNACLFQISKHEKGYEYYFRKNLPEELRIELRDLTPEIVMKDHDQIINIINQYTLCIKAQEFISCFFAHIPRLEEFLEVEHRGKTFFIKRDGKEVSWAWAQEENDKAIELAVETLIDYRRKGFARQVVTACAYHAITMGKIAFYSFLKGNSVSEALAKSLNVKKYAEITSYS